MPGGYIPTQETKQRECWKFETRDVNSEFESRVSVQPSNIPIALSRSPYRSVYPHCSLWVYYTPRRSSFSPLFLFVPYRRSFFSLGLKRRSGFLTHSRPHSSVISLLRSAVHRSFSHIFIALLVALCISRPKEKWKYGHKDIINPGNHPPVFSLDATLH